MELKLYFAIIKRWAWLLLLGLGLAAIVGFLASAFQTPVYEAVTKVLVIRGPESQAADFTFISERELGQTYVELLTTQPVLADVGQRLGFLVEAEQVRALQVPDTRLLEVTVAANDAGEAAQIANTLIAVLIEQNEALQASGFTASEESLEAQIEQVEAQMADVQAEMRQLAAASAGGNALPEDGARANQLQTTLALYQQIYASLRGNYENVRLARLQNTPNVVQVEPALPPAEPVRPRPLRNGFLAGIVGLLLAAGVVFLLEYLDTTLKTPADVDALLQLPVLGFIAQTAGLASSQNGIGAYVAVRPRSVVGEAFRTLRTNLEFTGVDKPLQTLLVTSPRPGEGKTTVATNLAIAFAQTGKRVLLVDADLRRPHVHRFLRLGNQAGLSDLFRDKARVETVVQAGAIDNLQVISSGALPPNPVELLGSERMARILAEMAQLADVVVIDSPPGIVADAAILAARVDGVLMIIQPGQTQAEAAVATLTQLERAGANVVGAVFNQIPQEQTGYYGGYETYSDYNEHYANGDGDPEDLNGSLAHALPAPGNGAATLS